ncbi:MAG: hypothetical protein COA78_32035, partial [Blastopirellula sp.]
MYLLHRWLFLPAFCLLMLALNVQAGFVLAPGIVRVNGNIVWVEYNPKGGYRILSGIEDNDAHVISGNELLSYEQHMNTYLQRNPSAQYLTIEQYNTSNISTKTGQPLEKPLLPIQAKVVLLPATQDIHAPGAAFLDYIWLPYDMKRWPSISSDENGAQYGSYLLSEDDQILAISASPQHRIGQLVEYYLDADANGNPVVTDKVQYELDLLNNNDIAGGGIVPIPGSGAGTEVTSPDVTGNIINPLKRVGVTSIFGAGITNSDGWFSPSSVDSPICERHPTPWRYTLTATFNARTFNAVNPKLRDINAYGYGVHCYNVTSNIYLSVQNIAGKIQLAHNNETIPVSDATRFHIDSERNQITDLSSIDYDGDGAKDSAGYLVQQADGQYTAIAPPQTLDDATHIGIYFTGNPKTDPDTGVLLPNLIRVVDRNPHLNDQGLLQSINQVDLLHTDLYVFRESNGQLVTHHKGTELNTEDDDRSTGGVGDSVLQYSFVIRSPDYFYQNFHPYEDYAGWASATKLAEPFQENNADHIRVGERLRLVAINRATGYMGSTLFTSKDPNQNSNGATNSINSAI